MQCLLLPGGGSIEVDAPSPRSSSHSLVPMRRLNTIQESELVAGHPSAAQYLHSGEQAGGPSGPGGPRGSSLRGHRKAPLPAHRRWGTQLDTEEGAAPDTGSPLLGTSSQQDTDGH